MFLWSVTLESSRFEDENEYEYEIKLKVFARVLKKRHPGKLHFPFFFFFHQKKLTRLFILKEVKPSPDRRVKELLTFNNLLPPLRHAR